MMGEKLDPKFLEFLDNCFVGLLSGEIKVTDKLTYGDMAVQYAVGCIVDESPGEKVFFTTEQVVDVIYERCGKMDDIVDVVFWDPNDFKEIHCNL